MENDNFLELIKRDKTSPSDVERIALFTIFGGNEDLYSKVNSLYDFKEHSIKSDCFSKVDLSSGAYHLVKLAFNLFNSANEANVSDVFSYVDQQNYDLAMKAINIRFNKI